MTILCIIKTTATIVLSLIKGFPQFRHGNNNEPMPKTASKNSKRILEAEGFSMDNFYATEAAMRMVMMAYNLMSLYRQVSQGTSVQQRLSTLRFNCFAVGSWIVKQGNKRLLKMSVPLKRRQWFDGLFENIRGAPLPLSLQL